MFASPPSAYDARAVANFVLDLAERDSQPLTQISLLKILYFAHGWYLAAKGRPLVSQPIEAWKYGPVIKVVKDAFKEFEGKPINKRAERLILQTGEIQMVRPDLREEDAEFVESVFRQYRRFGAWELSDITHEQGSPWDAVWNPKISSGRLGLRIRNDEIREYFLAVAGKGAAH
jgi:uncharacterized phage-associated protein